MSLSETEIAAKVRKAAAFVSTSFACATEVRELGEQRAMIQAVTDKLDEVAQYLEYLRASSHDDVRHAAQALFLALGDARHDASWAWLTDMAKSAAAEARVRPMKVSA